MGTIEKHNSGVLIFSDIRDIEDHKKRIPSYEIISSKFSFIVPELPKWCNKIYRFNDVKINPYQLKCSCKESQTKRKHFEARDVRVICKHIYWKISKTQIRDHVDNLTLEVMKLVGIFGSNKFLKLNVNGEDVHLAFKSKNDWITVLTKQVNDSWRKWGYNPFEERWSYEEMPKNKTDIELEIVRYFSNWTWLEKEE